MYGSTDAIQEYIKELEAALALLREVAGEKKTAGDVKRWLSKEYPDRCHSCGAKGEHGDYCSQCGTKLEHPAASSVPAGSKRCENCSTVNKETSKHCTKCGTPLSQPPQA